MRGGCDAIQVRAQKASMDLQTADWLDGTVNAYWHRSARTLVSLGRQHGTRRVMPHRPAKTSGTDSGMPTRLSRDMLVSTSQRSNGSTLVKLRYWDGVICMVAAQTVEV